MTNTAGANELGLSHSFIEEIVQVLRSEPAIERAVVFGSRAKGNYRNGSDVDIALYGSLDHFQVSHIEYLLNEETKVPLFFDVVAYDLVQNEALKAHIERVGKRII